jgi:hypothetical protein
MIIETLQQHGYYQLDRQEGYAIAEAVSRWLPTAAARVRPRGWQVGFVVDKVASGQVFSEYFGFPCRNCAFHQLLHPHNHPGQTRRGLAKSWSPVQGVLLTVLDLLNEMKLKVSWRLPRPKIGLQSHRKKKLDKKRVLISTALSKRKCSSIIDLKLFLFQVSNGRKF